MAQDIKQLLELAENGDPKAQYTLAVCYHSGKNGAEQDYVKAAEYYLKAAEQGHVKAAFYLGTLYQSGNGVEQDYEKAAICYEEAAEAGDDKARLALGLLYSMGQVLGNPLIQENG